MDKPFFKLQKERKRVLFKPKLRQLPGCTIFIKKRELQGKTIWWRVIYVLFVGFKIGSMPNIGLEFMILILGVACCTDLASQTPLFFKYSKGQFRKLRTLSLYDLKLTGTREFFFPYPYVWDAPFWLLLLFLTKQMYSICSGQK